MKISTFLPPEALQPFIKYTCFIETEADSGTPKTFVPVVDGCPGIMIQDPALGSLQREGKKLPAAFLFGQSTRRSELKLDGAFRAVYVYLRPHALGSLFHLNAEILTDTCVDLALLQQGKDLVGSSDESTSGEKQIDVLHGLLLDKLSRLPARENFPVSFILEQIMSSRGTYSLKELHRVVHMSERSFERKFKEQVGISAKLFSGICRFQSSFKQLNSRDFNRLTDIAFEHDYADQSHFIRVFKTFAGSTPLRFQKTHLLNLENLSEVLP